VLKQVIYKEQNEIIIRKIKKTISTIILDKAASLNKLFNRPIPFQENSRGRFINNTEN
jgi:hypothetical protein